MSPCRNIYCAYSVADNGRAGLQVQSLESSESVCVLLMKIMRFNLPLSLFPVYSLWAHSLDSLRSPGTLWHFVVTH